MADIGIGFKLHADATQMERELLKAKAGVRGLENQMKAVRTIGSALGGFGIVTAVVQGFSAAISKAQALRDAALKSGDAISANVAAAAKLGDAIDAGKEAMTSFGAETIGVFAKAGEAAGKLLRVTMAQGKGLLQGKGLRESTQEGLDQLASGERAEKGAEFQAASLKVSKDLEDKRNAAKIASLETEGKIAEIKKQIAEDEEKMAKFAEDDLRRIPFLKEIGEKKIQLESAQAQLQKELVDSIEKQVEKERQAEKRKDQLAEAENKRIASLKEQQGNAQSRVNDVSSNLATAKADRSKMSLQELANISPLALGVGQDTINKSKTAREIMDIEGQADQKRLAGDVTGSMELRSKADELRGTLGDAITSKESNPFGDMGKELAEARKTLEKIDEKLAGKFINSD